MAPDLEAAARSASSGRRRRPRCSPLRPRSSCCREALRRPPWRRNVAPGTSQPRRDAPVHAAAPPSPRAVGGPVVATSGNLSDEPICIDEREALAPARRRSPTSSSFTIDRSTATWTTASSGCVRGEPRRPAPGPRLTPRCRCSVDRDLPDDPRRRSPHEEQRWRSAVGRQVFVSQHIGDLETPEALDAFERVDRRFPPPLRGRARCRRPRPPPRLRLDPLGRSRRAGLGRRSAAVQHHHAHLAACLAENGETGPALGVTWDGTGFGERRHGLGRRVPAWRRRRLRRASLTCAPSGSPAARRPFRSHDGRALALLCETLGERCLRSRRPRRSFGAFALPERTAFCPDARPRARSTPGHHERRPPLRRRGLAPRPARSARPSRDRRRWPSRPWPMRRRPERLSSAAPRCARGDAAVLDWRPLH